MSPELYYVLGIITFIVLCIVAIILEVFGRQ